MRHFLNIRMDDAEGAVLRAIGLMERRGFQLVSCTAHEAQGGQQKMEVCLESTRPTDLIKRQLERLHDVQQVEIIQAAPGWADAAGNGQKAGA